MTSFPKNGTTGKKTFSSRYHTLNNNKEARKQMKYTHSFQNMKTTTQPLRNPQRAAHVVRTLKKNQHYSRGPDSLMMGYTLRTQHLNLSTWKDTGKIKVGKVGWNPLQKILDATPETRLPCRSLELILRAHF